MGIQIGVLYRPGRNVANIPGALSQPRLTNDTAVGKNFQTGAKDIWIPYQIKIKLGVVTILNTAHLFN
jgi:hypothetical protein